jgi:hypothetical protein
MVETLQLEEQVQNKEHEAESVTWASPPSSLVPVLVKAGGRPRPGR